jgi:hypothetical protein
VLQRNARMTTIKTSLLLALLLLPSAAFAEELVLQGPRAGTRELRLDQGVMPSFSGINSIDVDSERLTLIGLNPGFGKFVTDNVELGASVSLLIAQGGDSVVWSPGVAPFVRVMSRPAPWRFYGELALFYQPVFTRGDLTHLYGAGASAGVEFAIRESWSFRIGPSFRHLRAGDEGGVNLIGANWAIAAYF